jgi:DNA-binding transcriptional ArsR family regulator
MVKFSETLDKTFSALADPTRRAILERLAGGEAPVTEIAAPFDMSLPAIMKHLGVLEGAGLVACRKSGRVRRCHIDPTVLTQTISWLQDRQAVWEKRLDALESVVKEGSR